MANKGDSGYMKRLNAPIYFGIERKGHAYVTNPNPGRHTLEKCLPLTVVIRRLGAVRGTEEAKRAIISGGVTVNGKVVKEPKYPVGMEDVIEVGGERHKITINKQGKSAFVKSHSRKEILFKIVGKYKDRNNKTMLRLHDGAIIESKGAVKVNDSVLLSDGKIEKTLKLEVGSPCMIIDGVHVGTEGKVAAIVDGSMQKPKSAVVESGKSKFETLVRNIMVTG